MHKITFIMMLCSSLSRVLGFIRVGVIGAFFGAGVYADVLNLVLSIPNNFRKLFAEGALSSSFMPLFAKTIQSDDETNIKVTKESQVFFSTLLFWFILIVGVFVICANIFAKPIVAFLFRFDSQEKIVLAVRLFSFVIYFLFFNTISAILIGIQQTHKKFFLVAILPTILSLSVISFIFLFVTSWGIFSAVVGYLVGAILQVIMLCITLTSLGYKLHLSWKFSSYVKQTLRRMVPASFAVIIPIIGQQVAFYLASGLPVSSSSAFAYAIVFWQLPIGIVFNSIIVVSFSNIIVALGKKNNKLEVFEYEQNSLYSLLFFSIPIGIVMFFLAHAGVAVALQRGKLDAAAVYLTSRVLQGYALSLIPYGVYQMMQKILYARGKINVVFVFSAIFTVVDILLSIILVRTKLGVSGLSFAYALSFVIVLPILSLYLLKYTKAHVLSFREIFKMFIANIPLVIMSFMFAYFTKDMWYNGSTFINILAFCGITFVLAVGCIMGYRGVGISLISIIRSYKNIK